MVPSHRFEHSYSIVDTVRSFVQRTPGGVLSSALMNRASTIDDQASVVFQFGRDQQLSRICHAQGHSCAARSVRRVSVGAEAEAVLSTITVTLVVTPLLSWAMAGAVSGALRPAQNRPS